MTNSVLKSVEIKPVSMVSKEGLQRVELNYICDDILHMQLEIFDGDKLIETKDIAFMSGERKLILMLKPPAEDFDARFVFKRIDGEIICTKKLLWRKPREWTLYTMLSSHTDIGLHNSQYVQRFNSEEFLEKAMSLCDETDCRDDGDKYRYTMEGTWFWSNYVRDKGQAAVKNVVENYIKPGKIGVCSGIAGNHTHVFGLEEMCRSTYPRKWLKDNFGLDIETFTMIDNNGISWAVIEPYAQAGYKNLIFAPNHWNPIKSTIWNYDESVTGAIVNPEAGGGGSRIDVRYDSKLPMVFYWQNKKEDEKILVWCSTQYHYGGVNFGIYEISSLFNMESKISNQLPKLEEKYPYDIWLMASYSDDEEPNLKITDYIEQWNAKWAWPKIRTLGNPDLVFNKLREKFDDVIPVLKGEITGGWQQHPLTTPELLAAKFETDRLLPTAEKFSVVASVVDEKYLYPASEFERAWEYLLLNDEHSYGTSGYQGQRVYETWMQHRDWIDKAMDIASLKLKDALSAIGSHIPAEDEKVVVFNQTSLEREEIIEYKDGCVLAKIPPFGYKTFLKTDIPSKAVKLEKIKDAPVVENKFYVLKFAENGSIISIFDKQLGRELVDHNGGFNVNEFVYTNDNHKSFVKQCDAEFEIVKSNYKTVVNVKTCENVSGAEIIQKISLPEFEKRIDIDNILNHVSDLYNNDRYYRYLYCAFPFDVENAERLCHLNGTVAEYAKDLTGHSTDVYMAVNEWCCVQNEKIGIGLMMADSQVVEFDHIHPDKTDYGNPGDGSSIFCYLANDWLQMHTAGGSHLNFRFRYSITSFEGDYISACLPQMAERFVNPVICCEIPKQSGKLDSEGMSFLNTYNARLVNLKRPTDGNGMIARLYRAGGDITFDTGLPIDITFEEITVDESRKIESCNSGFRTFRLCKDDVKIETEYVDEVVLSNDKPAEVGAVYTGLITSPCAARGEDSGHLYLLWGQNMEENLSHYKLYRSENDDFTPSQDTFIADVEPGKYRVVSYQDKGLKEHTRYYYSVCAVNKNGVCGDMSEIFSGITKEDLK